jgi:hypothetical protein
MKRERSLALSFELAFRFWKHAGDAPIARYTAQHFRP